MKILIVDDAKETRESLHNIIKAKIDSTYEIIEAQDGLEALGLVDSLKPDIVLTDILMPKMDGIRFTSILKSHKETRHIFVAAITGLSGEEQVEKIYASGVDFYIAKPFQLDDIVARLKVITSLIKHESSIPKVKPTVVYNCFEDEHIKHYFTTFSIAQENDIFLIFDYFSKQDISYNSIILKDFMVTLVKTYRKIDTKDKIFDIIIEESESYIYITVKDAFFVSAIENLVDKHSTLLEYKRTEQAVSFRIYIAKFMQNTKSEQKVDVYQNELMSAKDLMIISSDDLDMYVKDLQDALLDYRALSNDDNTYNNSLYLALITLLDQYIYIFRKVPEFDRVSIALQSLTDIIHSLKNKKLTTDKNTQLTKHIENLNINIELWIKAVIVNQDASDIHYADYEIINICRNVENDFN